MGMTVPDRLSPIESRWREAGCGDGDKAWLIAQVRRERRHALWVERRCWRTIPLYEVISRLQVRIEAAEEERNRERRHRKWALEQARTLAWHLREDERDSVAAVLDEALNSGDGAYRP